MPNSGNIEYQFTEIRRKLLLIEGNERLSSIERELLEDITDGAGHLTAIERHFKQTTGRLPILCPICQSALDQAGKCPKRGDEEHLKLTTLNSRQDNSLPSG